MIMKNINKIGKVFYHADFNEDTFYFRHNNFSELIPKNSTVLDIGAHVGSFAMIFGSCSGKSGNVLAFEPNPKTFKILKQNAESNIDFNIIPINLACTREEGNFKFHYSDPNIYGIGTNGGFFDGIEKGEEIKRFHSFEVDVKGVNVYEFLIKNYPDLIDEVKFIKIDTEGFDKEVIKTLKPLIETNKPVLMVEAFRSLTNEEINDFYDTISSLGYYFYDVSPLDNKNDCTGPITKEEISYYIRNVMDNGNFFCFHKDETSKYNLPVTIPGKTAAVVSSRNDGYKEKERFLIHITALLETFDEVVYVDWNSPTSSLLYEIIDELPNFKKLKHIVVPKEIHQLISEDIPNLPNCFDSLALNIGIRRTDAEWIVITTADVIPPFRKDFIDYLQKCNKSTFYTLSRREVEYLDIIKNKPNLNEYREHLNKTSTPRYFPAKVTPNDEFSIINCCGDFQLASKNIFLKVRGYEENMCYKCFIDTNIQKKAKLYGFDLKAYYDLPLYHMSHKNILPQGGNIENLHEVAKDTPPVYNDAWYWVETFDKYLEYDHIMFSRNSETWGMMDTEIEYEII
jgi:FkbM family methyltransferase